MVMVESVARAILKARFYDCEPEMYGFNLDVFFREIDQDHVFEANGQARAAIEAMRKPTGAMVEALYHEDNDGEVEHAYSRAIDAALNEQVSG